MVFSVPFPNGNCFCALCTRRSLGLRMEFPLFLLVLDVGQGTNKEQAGFDLTRSEGESEF